MLADFSPRLAKLLFSNMVSLLRWRISLLRYLNVSSPRGVILRKSEILTTLQKRNMTVEGKSATIGGLYFSAKVVHLVGPSPRPPLGRVPTLGRVQG